MYGALSNLRLIPYNPDTRKQCMKSGNKRLATMSVANLPNNHVTLKTKYLKSIYDSTPEMIPDIGRQQFFLSMYTPYSTIVTRIYIYNIYFYLTYST